MRMMKSLRFFIFIFFLLFFLGTFLSTARADVKQECKDLEDRVVQILGEQYSFKGRGFVPFPYIYDYTSGMRYGAIKHKVTPDVCVESLRSFKLALERTEHKRSFDRISAIFLTSRDIYLSNPRGKNRAFVILAGQTVEFYVGMLTEKPLEEPAYQQYLEGERKLQQEVDERMIQLLSPMENKIYRARKDLFCGQDFVSDQREMSAVLASVTGLGVKKIKKLSSYRKKNYFDVSDNFRKATYAIEFALTKETPLIYVEVTTYDGFYRPYLKIYLDVFKKSSVLFFHCGQDKIMAGRNWYYEKGSRDVARKELFNSRGELIYSFYLNRRVKTLAQIYSGPRYSKLYSEILRESQRTDRVLVAVLDGGVDYNHPDLAYKIERPDHVVMERLWSEYEQVRVQGSHEEAAQVRWQLALHSIGWDFQDDDAEPYDYFINVKKGIEGSHGTQVSSIAVDSPEIALLPVRYPFLNRYNKQRLGDVFRYIEQRGAKIINMSYMTTGYPEVPLLKKAIKAHPDILFVAAAGNDGANLDNFPVYPAVSDQPNVITVTSVDADHNLSSFANYSVNEVDVAAPGENILVAFPESSWATMGGTSMAAPFVTRIAARIKYINPALTPAQIIGIITATLTPVESLTSKLKYGGVVHEERALAAARKTLEGRSP